MRKYFLLLVLLSRPGSPLLASPPSGQPPANARQALERSTQVFVGEVVQVKKDPLGYDSLAKVRVKRVIKGSVKGVVGVSGQGGPTYPARLFKTGQVELFFLGDDLHADSYTNRVTQGMAMQEDLRQIGR